MSQNAPYCILALIHFKTFPGMHAPGSPQEVRGLRPLGIDRLLPKTINPRNNPTLLIPVYTFSTFAGRSFDECLTISGQRQQYLDEIFKRFRHDPTFLRAKEKSYGSRAKVPPNSNLIRLPFDKVLTFFCACNKVADPPKRTKHSFDKFVEQK